MIATFSKDAQSLAGEIMADPIFYQKANLRYHRLLASQPRLKEDYAHWYFGYLVDAYYKKHHGQKCIGIREEVTQIILFNFLDYGY